MCAGSRLLVQTSIYDKVIPKLKAFENIKVGDPFDKDIKMGAQTGPDQIEKLKAILKLQKKIAVQLS